MLARAARVLQAELAPTAWQAFRQYVLLGRPAAEVATELGVTVNVVHLTKSRALQRLRVEFAGLLD